SITACPPPPSNDLCSGATNLPCGTTALAGTTVNSTNTAHGTACSMSNYGVWYSFVGDGNNTTITIDNAYDIELSISSGSCGTFTNIICTDYPESHSFTTVNGVTYYVYVAYYSSGSSTTGTFDISRSCSVPGAECVPNTVIGALPYVQTGFNTAGSGDDFDNADACASYYMDGDDYVFTYTPAANTCVNIALSNTSTWVGLFVTQGCPTTGSCVAYNTNSSGNPSVQDVYLTGGVEYFITVSTNPSPQTTPFDISVTACPPPITACSGTFKDSGGNSDYGNNEYTKITYCSGSTDCISFNFTLFDLESYSDYLDVYDGASTSSPFIDSYTGTELNGVTLTSSSSCLTFVFDSDGSVTEAGWSATISCAACPPPPPPVSQDCAGGTSICSDASFSGNSDGYGFIEELNSSNDDCLSGENQTSWYFFEAATAGTLEFGIKPQNGTDDYDFAMWGPYPSGSTPSSICPPAGAPVRCSYSAGAPNPATGTGLMSGAGDTSEGVSGDDVVNPLVLNVGDVYILVIDNYSSTTSPFDMDLSLTGGLTLNCNQLPIELISFDGFAEDGFNLLKWSTAVEINNNYFEIEKSLNGMLFEKIAQVTGAGNSNTVNNYQFIDNDAYKGVSYYRLKQIDYDGAMSYSSVVAVKQSLRAEVSIFPNPTVDKVKMNFVSKEDGVYRIVVSDVSKVIYERTLAVARGNKIVNFDSFNELAKGFYIIQIIDENGNIIKTERVVKQ
ncbi:MAG: T9SS type A sorting domain-containing protein, partial [Flavobacteriales bacterium]|nr:T9SS type A sorting domain-containing protein [Flavobacteriales bacterium]